MVKATKNLGTAIYIEGLQLGVRIVDCVAKHMDHPIAASRQQKSDAHGLDVSIHVQLRIADVVQSSRGFEHVLYRTGTHTGTLVQHPIHSRSRNTRQAGNIADFRDFISQSKTIIGLAGQALSGFYTIQKG